MIRHFKGGRLLLMIFKVSLIYEPLMALLFSQCIIHPRYLVITLGFICINHLTIFQNHCRKEYDDKQDT